MKYESLDEIMDIAYSAEGCTFSEIDKTGRINQARNKGGLGHIIEESLFEYNINSDSKADFSDFNLELKVTPVKINKNGTISAKERLVLNIINYMEEVFCTFETSSFWRKNQRLLIFFYLWEEDLKRADYKILKTLLYDYPEEDLEIIKDDWEYIVDQIRIGKAEDLSEADTMYLGACPKGANKNSLREQPYSDVLAMQRAYCLKNSYMTSIVRQHLDKEKVVSFANKNELKTKTLKEILYERFEPYIGMNLIEISETIGYDINKSNKATIPDIVSEILGIKGTKLNDIAEFAKANIKFKTIRLEPNGKPKEHMSFDQVDFNKWIDEEFEDSIMYENFSKTKYLFVVFQYDETVSENKNRVPYLKKVILWNMPKKTIQTDLKDLWTSVREILLEGVKLEKKGNRVFNNLPKAGDNPIGHIRPKARDGKDRVQLPDGQWITKQGYWLNRDYIAKIVE